MNGLAAALLALAAGAQAGRAEGGTEFPYQGEETRVVANIFPPSIPARQFPITDYGARPGADASGAIRAAIEACVRLGGGHVVVPAGSWTTGAIRLESHVDLHLEHGATLLFSSNPADYPLVRTRFEGVECMNFSSFIFADSAEDVAVTGDGTLDGGATDSNWWGWTKRGSRADQPDRAALFAMGEKGVPVEARVFGPGHHLRPEFICVQRCRRVLIEGVHIVRSPMWEIHPCLSESVAVRGVDILSHGPNNDGCDPECCNGVLIEQCTFDTGDDCIAIKSGRNNDGRRVGRPSENIVVRGCRMRDGHGGVVIGSEISGGCRNVYAESCVMDSPRLNYALRLKSNAARGGVLEHIHMWNVRIGSVSDAVLTVDLLYEEGPRGAHPPVVRDVTIDHATGEDTPHVAIMAGFKGAEISGVKISHSQFRGVVAPQSATGAEPVTLEDVSLAAAGAAADRP